MCPNCGLDLATPWVQAPKRRTKAPVIAGIVAVAAMIGISVLIVASSKTAWQPAAEPSPQSAWYAFTSPDNSWTIRFPGSPSPRTMTQSIDTGFGVVSTTYYVTVDAGATYEAAAFTLPPGADSSDAANLRDFERGLEMFARITNSRDLQFQSHLAREVRFTWTSADLEGYARFWLDDQRMYMLMVMAATGTTMYPQHFFESFGTV